MQKCPAAAAPAGFSGSQRKDGHNYMSVGSIVSSIGNLSGVGAAAAGAVSSAAVPDGTAIFKDVLDKVVSSVNQTDSAFEGDIVRAAAGELENPHQLLIDSEKANVSLQLAVSVRNKALEAYTSIMNMQV